GSSNGTWRAYRSDQRNGLGTPSGAAFVGPPVPAAQINGASGYTPGRNGARGGSDLLWGALGLTLANLAREAQAPHADSHLVAALSQVADGRYPHSWSAAERAQAVAQDTIAPLATALLRSYVGAARVDDHMGAPVSSNGSVGLESGYAGNGYTSNGPE